MTETTMSLLILLIVVAAIAYALAFGWRGKEAGRRRM